MPQTEAQKRAKKAYRERRGISNIQKTIGATVSPAEAERIKTALKSVNMTNAEALKRAADRIEQGDDLRRDYDKAADKLIDRKNA